MSILMDCPGSADQSEPCPIVSKVDCQGESYFVDHTDWAKFLVLKSNPSSVHNINRKRKI